MTKMKPVIDYGDFEKLDIRASEVMTSWLRRLCPER